MTSFHHVEVSCPCCSTLCKVMVLMSTNNFGGQYTDFHEVAVGFPPIPLMMNTCPNCGYSGYASAFEDTGSIAQEIRQKVLDELAPLVREAAPDGGRRYEFAAKIAEWNEEESAKIADYYLRAAWSCVDEQRTEHEVRYRQAAVDYFKKALEHHEFSPEVEPNITYLIGELYRRIDDMESAREWFNTVITWAKTDSSSEKMAALAQQQRDDPKDMFEKRK